MALPMKLSLVKPHCIEHVGDLYFQCPVQLTTFVSGTKSKLHSKEKKEQERTGLTPLYSLVIHNDVDCAQY